MTTLTFLGTGGGRFATIYQVRATGGLYIKDTARVHIDPGPTALYNMSRLHIDPAKTDAVLISHCHPDHYSDAEVLVEGMTRGGLKKRGMIVGSRSVLEGYENHGPALSRYHQSIPEKALAVKGGDKFNVGAMEVKVTTTRHSDPSGVGFILGTQNGSISYMSDTEFDYEVIRQHAGSRILILALTRPMKSRVSNHICTEDALEIAQMNRPQMIILTHFGAKLVHEGPDRQAQFIEENSGVRTVAAEDLMNVHVGKVIRVSKNGEQTDPELDEEKIDSNVDM
jgi:phosphoribosyl 1,2-cyclic phosphodiesterase